MNDTLDRARMPLLTLVTQEALDRDYQTAASRRGAETPGRPGRRLGVVLVVAAFAALVTVAAVQTSQNADVNDASRASLIKRVEALRGRVDTEQEQISALRGANTAAEDDLRALGTRLGRVQADRTSLGASTGFEVVRGDGVRVVLKNPRYADEDTEIRDSDLALLADALWGAGAEAIAINGQRLTALSGIRNSGVAVEVNGVGIAPPYTVLAIGDQRTLSANLVDSGAGLTFIGITQQFGYDFAMEKADGLRLPAASGTLPRLSSAKPTKPTKNDGGDRP
ncbi:DUF881 domain-containing protein [Nocardioides sp. W3-2-3]|nr:DUF881 domain-containing protein [Nocardioides convexus]